MRSNDGIIIIIPFRIKHLIGQVFFSEVQFNFILIWKINVINEPVRI